MSRQFYILYSQINSLKPKLYKRLAYAQKIIAQNPQYKIRQYDSQTIANNMFELHQIEHKKYLNKLKQNQLSQKIHQLKESNTLIQNQPNITPKPKPTLVIPKQDQSGFIKPKTVEELQNLLKPLMNLTPDMPEMYQPFVPTPILKPINRHLTYTGFFDGCSKKNPGPSSVGFYMTHGDDLAFQGFSAIGVKTNNQAEFTSLLYLITNAYLNGIRKVTLYGDSKLIVDAMNKKVRISYPLSKSYDAASKVMNLLDQWSIQHVQRKYNTRADKLSNQAFKIIKKSKAFMIANIDKNSLNTVDQKQL